MDGLLDIARETLLEVLVDEYIPTDPNATRVRYSGGTENLTGEMDGAAREGLRLAVFLGYISEDLEVNSAGKRGDSSVRAAVYLEDVLEVGDKLELDSGPEVYKVAQVGTINVGEVLAYEADLEEVSRG